MRLRPVSLPGDTIFYVGQVRVKTQQECYAQIGAKIGSDAPVQLKTDRGTYILVPEAVEVEQCYWDIGAGHVGQSGGWCLPELVWRSRSLPLLWISAFLPYLMPNCRRLGPGLSVQLARMRFSSRC